MEHREITLSGKLSEGVTMLVDADDFDRLSGVKWHLSWNGYAVNRSRVNGKNTNIRAHRLLVDAPEGYDIDHINGNKLDNRKSNLRVCTRSENLSNRTSAKGAYLDRRRGTWQVEFKVEKKKAYIGAFNDEELARHIYHDIKKQLIGGTISRRSKATPKKEEKATWLKRLTSRA